MTTTIKNIWTRWKVTIQITNELMAGIPKNKELIKTWLESRKPSDAAFTKRDAAGEVLPTVDELTEQVASDVGANDTKDKDTAQAEEDFSWLGFRKDDERGLWVRGSDMKAHIKDCANILKDLLELKALRSKVADRVYVVEEAIWFGKMDPDGHIEPPVHVMTRMGKRSALKRNDYILRPEISFTLRVLDDDVIDEELLRAIFDYGGTHGFGAERGLGYGRYTLELLEKQEPLATGGVVEQVGEIVERAPAARLGATHQN